MRSSEEGNDGKRKKCTQELGEGGSPGGQGFQRLSEGEKETIFGVDANRHAAGVGKKSQVGKDRRRDN